MTHAQKSQLLGQPEWDRTTDLRFPEPARYLCATGCYLVRAEGLEPPSARFQTVPSAADLRTGDLNIS